MGSPQTSINPAGQSVGMAGTCTAKLDAYSTANKETSTAIGYGLGVKPGTNARESLLPTASSSVLGGVTIRQDVNSPGSFGNLNQDSTPAGVRPGSLMEVLRLGRCYVQVDADCTVTPNVTRAYMRFESDGASNTTVGAFRHSDDTHVVDVRKQVLFVGPVVTAADGTKIAEVSVRADNSPS